MNKEHTPCMGSILHVREAYSMNGQPAPYTGSILHYTGSVLQVHAEYLMYGKHAACMGSIL